MAFFIAVFRLLHLYGRFDHAFEIKGGHERMFRTLFFDLGLEFFFLLPTPILHYEYTHGPKN